MAGRIPQPFLDELLDRADIVELINARVPLKKVGKEFSACCPFHDEKTPSFTVSPQKQMYYCFGCGAGGNVLGFLMEHDHLDFPAAVEVLAQQAGLEVPRESLSPQEETRRRQRADIYSELEKAARYYQDKLRQHPPALNYLQQRGLSPDLAADFALGYAPNSPDGLAELYGTDPQAIRRLIAGGMLIEREQPGRGSPFYDRFRDRLMFPIRDQRGRTIAFGGRVFGDQKPKYLNSPETPVFHKSRELYGLYEVLQQRQKPQQLLVVEGYMDVLVLAQHGLRNAVATLGTAIGAAHIERLFRQVSEIVFCFDGDAAGRRAAERALHACLPAMLDGRRARFLFLPEGEDPDSLVRREGRAGFEKRMQQAQPLSDFVFKLAGSGLDLQNSEHRAAFAKQTLPFLQKLPKGLLHGLLLQELSAKTGIDQSTLAELAEQIAKQPPPQSPSAQPRQADENHSTATAQTELGGSDNFRYVLRLILQLPRLALNLDQQLLDRLDHDRLLARIRKRVKAKPDVNFVHLHGTWLAQDPTLARKLQRFFGARLLKEPTAEKLERDYEETLAHLQSEHEHEQDNHEIIHEFNTPYNEMSTEQRAKIQALHWHRSKLPQHQPHHAHP